MSPFWTDFSRSLYTNVFKRNSTFIGFILVGAVLFEVSTNTTIDSVWNRLNKGKLWPDVLAQIEARKSKESH